MAGARTAQYLTAKGMKVVVLEARDRPGGRIWTDTTTTINGVTVPLELGAAWIHGPGSSSNPIKPLALQASAALASRNTDWENGRLFLGDGREASDAQETAWDATFDNFYPTYFKSQRSGGGTSDPGMGALADKYAADRGITGDALFAFKFNLDTSLQHEYGGPIANLSLWHEQDSVASGDLLVTGGYQRLVEHLLKGIDVRYSTPVTAIDYGASASVKVTASAATFSAPWVVCTVPLGVLKAGSIAFTPALPSTNTAAIAALGMGLLDKVVLVFPSAFWGSSLEVLNYIDPNGAGEWEEFISMAPTAIAGKPVLVAFAAATYAESMEAKGDAEVLESVMSILRKMFGSSIPAPTKYFVTRWNSDPYARGSYSYTKRLSSGSWSSYSSVHKNTGLPVGCSGCSKKRLHFAGEHTRDDYPATVQGAYSSADTAACGVLTAAGKTCL